jgi:hypothetical protein
VHIFTPSLVNEDRFGYTRHNGSLEVLDQQAGVSFAAANESRCIRFRCSCFHRSFFRIRGPRQAERRSSLRSGSGGPNLNIENLFQGADDLSWTKGSHSMKMGADMRRDRFDTI